MSDLIILEDTNNLYPIAKQIPHDISFGLDNTKFRGNNIELLTNPPITHNDNYFWIRDDLRTNKDVLDLITAENNYTKTIMEEETKKQLNNQIYKELKSYMKEDYKTYPLFEHSNNSRYKYFKEYQTGNGYYIYKRLDINTNEEIILLDINKLAKNKEQCDVTSITHSLNEEYFSYCVDYNGSEEYLLVIQKIKIIEFLDTSNKMIQRIESIETLDTSNIDLISYGNYKWINDHTIMFIKTDDSNRSYQLWSWNIDTKEKTLIYDEINSEMSICFYTSSDMKYIFISSSNYNSTVVYWIDINDDLTKYYQFHPFVSGLKYSLNHHSGYFYIKTNNDNATNWKICRVAVNLVNNKWSDFIGYNKDVYIKSMIIIKDYLIFMSKINGAGYINMIDLSKEKDVFISNFIDFNTNIEIENYHNQSWSSLWPNSVYTISFHNNIYDSNYLYLKLETMTDSCCIIKYNLDKMYTSFKDNYSIVYKKEVPNYDSSLYKSERIYAELENGIKIPISLIYHKDKFNQDGSSPLYLYGYGSYGLTIEPTLKTSIIPLLDRGYVYAIAHVRGGAFLGYNWYEDGKLKNKLNTFTDFIACTEHLINKSYTNSKSITIDGRSAGGLLVGAVMTMRPELYKNVIMGVPFVDVLNTMCDSTIPLTVEEWSQWGNPNIKEDYDYMSLYCPYTNLKKTNYPNVYITAGLYDPRVQYWEPLKFISKLRSLKTDNNIQLIKINTQQGHFGGSNRYKYLEESAEQYTFVLSM